MPKIPVEFAEWRPDLALLDNKFAADAENVFADVSSYKPFPGLAAFSIAPLSDAGNDQYTKVLLNFDSGFTDSNTGGSAHTWTAAGGATVSPSDFKFAPGGLLLDGVDDKISTPAHADFNLGAQDFSIEAWFNCTAAAGGGARIIIGQSNSTGTTASTSFKLGRVDSLFFTNMMAAFNIGGVYYEILSTDFYSNTINPGWHHIEVSRFGNKLMMFIDGTMQNEELINGSVNASSNALAVGANGEDGDYWKGGIDAVRLSVGIARHTQNFVPPKAPYFNAGGRVCGLTAARASDGTWKIYAGTASKLFSWALAGWAELTGTSGPYNVADGDLWSFEQSGPHLVAVNVNDPPQWVEIDSPSDPFEDLPGTPPWAGNVKQIGDFLVLSDLAIGTLGMPSINDKWAIQWSGINDITSWIAGTSLGDIQVFPDGGPVMSVEGGEIGYVLHDRSIRTMQFLPGDTTFIFNFSRVLHDRGCISKYGALCIGNVLYFVAEDGFYNIVGQQVTPVGADKVDDWFRDHSDLDRRNLIQVFSFVNKPRMAWAFYATAGSHYYDKLIIFDWSNGRWTHASETAQVWATTSLASVDLDLDTDSTTEVDDHWLDSNARSLDSFAYHGGRPLIGGIDEDGYLAALDGPNLQATIETAELHMAPGRRAFVSEAYPLDDVLSAAIGLVVAGTRETLHDAIVWNTPVSVETSIGSAFLLTSSRLHRFRRIIPARSTWTHAQGLLVEAQQDGDVA